MNAGLATGSLTVQNVEATGPYTITAISINGATSANITGLTAANSVFSAGRVLNIDFGAASSTCGVGGTTYDYNITITYNSPNINGLKQYGTKNLIGKCT